MKDIYKTLEFDLVINEIEKYSKTEKGLELIRNLKMIDDIDELKKHLALLDEFINYTVKYRSLVIYPHKDIELDLSKLDKGQNGNIDFFYQVSSLIDNSNIIKENSSKDDNFPLIMEIIHSLDDIYNLKLDIDKVITPDLRISDNASSTLKNIRRSLNNEINNQSSIMNKLSVRYKDILTSDRYTLRDSNYVLPVRTSYKNQISGIVIGESDTGLTSFIEPNEILESNIKIERLKREELEEIQRILFELSNKTRKYIKEIRNNFNLITLIDFNLAKANYALEIDAITADLVDERIIHLKNAKHPLIDKKKVVSNSFFLDKQKIMVISGPNAGGKTVCLKVIGLFVLMNQAGLALPTSEKAKLTYFDNIYVDMGDNQSLQDNLSTFSGHIQNLKEILERVTPSSLVILDELGTGTSPSEGEALGVGVISKLHDIGAFGIFTSHYEGLKKYALEHEYILNASMAFDEEHILPTYKLILGVAGKSFGLKISSNMGLDSEVIKVAEDYLQKKMKTDKELTLERLNQKIEELELEKINLENLENEFNKKSHHLDNEIEKYKRLENRIFLDAEKEKAKLVLEAKERIEEIIENLEKKETIKLHEKIASKKELDDLLEDEEDEEIENTNFNIGDYVRMIDSDVAGKVIKINKDQITFISEKGLTLKVKQSELSHFKPTPQKKKVIIVSFSKDERVPLELNIIGCRVEEGLEQLDKYLDDCISCHYKEVRIIHGSGTGRLRSAVHEFLNNKKEISSYRLGGLGEGGVGATVVYFK